MKHYRAATPFLQKQSKYLNLYSIEIKNPNFMCNVKPADKEEDGLESPSKEDLEEGLKQATNSRPNSMVSDTEQLTTRWVDIVTLPLMMAYVTRYIFGTDKLRPNAFEVRGLNGGSTGIIHCDDSAILSQWLKYITDNIIGLTHLQVRSFE